MERGPAGRSPQAGGEPTTSAARSSAAHLPGKGVGAVVAYTGTQTRPRGADTVKSTPRPTIKPLNAAAPRAGQDN